MPRNIFVNLPVKDVEKTKAFFTKLGFSFNPQFTNQNAASLIIEENIFAMLIAEPIFKTFTKKEIADASTTTEVITAISVESREKVDEIVKNAVEGGGKVHRDPQDHGWMYVQSIEDLDGHIWEFAWLDATQAPPSP